MGSIVFAARSIFHFVTWRKRDLEALQLQNSFRYRLDHEVVVYTAELDAIDVALCSPELRAKIEERIAVVLWRKTNAFVED